MCNSIKLCCVKNVTKVSKHPHHCRDTLTVMVGDLKFPCDQCKEAFAFCSELKFHKTFHQTIPTFRCMSKNCGKMYKSSNELNKHVLKHSGVVWDCDAKNCEYLTDDRRNLCAHKKKHLLLEGSSANHTSNSLNISCSLNITS